MPTITDAVFPPEPPLGPPVGPPVIPTGPLPLQYRHRTISGVSIEEDNIIFPWYWTRLDHPALNNNPAAIITVTAVGRIMVNDQTRTATTIQNPYPVGVVYNPVGDGRWYIYNLELQAMSINADFNVAINQETQAE